MVVGAPGEAEVTLLGKPQSGIRKETNIGNALYNNAGCWVVTSSLDVKERTVVCSWAEEAKVYLGPDPTEPLKSTPSWGERQGMYSKIVESYGIGTDNAIILARKDREGAVIWCRQENDFSKDCIEKTVSGFDYSPEEAKLTANCVKGTFSDFWGRKFRVENGTFIDTKTGEPLQNSSAGGSTVASTALSSLCPDSKISKAIPKDVIK